MLTIAVFTVSIKVFIKSFMLTMTSGVFAFCYITPNPNPCDVDIHKALSLLYQTFIAAKSYFRVPFSWQRDRLI